ncbi:MAG: gliding motility protein GldL [Bacteroidota bacterium]|nr:gliding motility protein GldL [Bacteroidota bacterium]
MNSTEFMQTKSWKSFIGYVYGWGASLVIIGALFKLQHWPFAGLFLTLGLCSEAIIFFLSAFEPPIEIPEWSKVYPQLRDDYELLDEDEFYPAPVRPSNKIGNNQFNELLENADISPELLNKLRKSLTDLTNTASGLSDISSAKLATDLYVKNMTAASESVNNFTEVNNNAGDSVRSSVEKLVESYSSTTDVLTNTGKTLGDSYKNLSEKISSNLNKIDSNSKDYSDQLDKLNTNLSALNTAYELQLKDSKDQSELSGKYNKDLDELSKTVNETISHIRQYQEHSRKMNENLEALNSVYGNMLGALNHKPKK